MGDEYCMKCRYCDSDIKENEVICPICNRIIDSMTNEEMQLIIGEGEHTLHYMLSFDYYRENPNSLKPRFNSRAFIGGALWFAYRKMYLYALVILLVSIALGSFLNIFLPYDSGRFVVAFLIGFYGDRLYYEYAKMKYHKIKSNLREGEDLNEKLEERGGTSKLILFLGIIGFGYFLIYLPISRLNKIIDDLYQNLFYY